MNFGEALELMKKDDWNKLARKGWNGRGMYIHKCTPPSNPFSDEKSIFEHRPYLEMKTVDNQFVPWVASQTDLLAEDWEVVAVNPDDLLNGYEPKDEVERLSIMLMDELKKMPHPYHGVLVKEDSFEILEIKQWGMRPE